MPPTTLPSKLCSSRKPSPVITMSAASTRSGRWSSSASEVEAGYQIAAERDETAGESARRPGPFAIC